MSCRRSAHRHSSTLSRAQHAQTPCDHSRLIAPAAADPSVAGPLHCLAPARQNTVSCWQVEHCPASHSPTMLGGADIPSGSWSDHGPLPGLGSRVIPEPYMPVYPAPRASTGWLESQCCEAGDLCDTANDSLPGCSGSGRRSSGRCTQSAQGPCRTDPRRWYRLQGPATCRQALAPPVHVHVRVECRSTRVRTLLRRKSGTCTSCSQPRHPTNAAYRGG